MAALGYILSAIIGASVATAALIVNRENKISEFRQEWINGLRDDVGSLISYLAMLVTKKTELKRDDKTFRQEYIDASAREEITQDVNKILSDISSCKTEIIKLSALIELRLNAEDTKRTEDENKMLGLLRRSRKECEHTEINRPDVEDLVSEIKNCTGNILKNEWEKTKKSESFEKIKKAFLKNKFFRCLLCKSDSK